MTVDLIWIHFQLAMQKGEKKERKARRGTAEPAQTKQNQKEKSIQ